MSNEPLRLAAVGLGNLGGKCLEAIAETPGLELVGVGDRRPELAAMVATPRNIPHFRDQRQLVGQLCPDVLLVTTPPGPAVELVRLAAKRGIDVVKAAPLARTLDEAVELVNLMASAGRRLTVLSPRRYYPSYQSLIESCNSLGKMYLGRAELILDWGRRFDWRGDRASAGGGVLLEAGYEMADLLTMTMGLPEEVYAVTGKQGRPHMVDTNAGVESLGIYDTDDTAVVALRYANGSAGSMLVSWVSAPAKEQVVLHGRKGSAACDPSQCILRAGDGQVSDRTEGSDSPVGALAQQLRSVVESSRDETLPSQNAAIEHLLTMAVIEAAYLSDRTGQVENPRHLLRARDFTPEQCLAARTQVE